VWLPTSATSSLRVAHLVSILVPLTFVAQEVGRALGATMSEEDDESILAELAEIEAEQALGTGVGVGAGVSAGAGSRVAAPGAEVHFSGVVFPEVPTTAPAAPAAATTAAPAATDRVAVLA
jgi:hypothetical protein